MSDEVELQQIQQKEEDTPVVGEMRRGDYMLHVFIERTKELAYEREDTVNPIIEVQCFGKRKYSSAKKNISRLADELWGEHIFIEAKNLEKEDAEQAKILISIQDKGIFRNDSIGSFRFDLSYIYFKKDHLMLHQWVALSNPDGNKYSEITGYLKVSISVVCTGDQQIEILEDDGSKPETQVMMPPQINPQFYQLKFRFFQAQEIAPMDLNVEVLGSRLRDAKTDAFIMMTYKNKKLKTKVLTYREGSQPINWNQEFWVPAQVPIIDGRIVVKVMNQGKVLGDETVGSILFDLRQIIEDFEAKKSAVFEWMNIYGSPLKFSSTAGSTKMNDNPEIASNWKGRILVQVTCEKTKKPLCKVARIPDSIITESKAKTGNNTFEIIGEVGQAVALPQNKEYTVKMIIGGKEFQTAKPKNSKKNYNRFDFRFEEQIVVPYLNIEQLGSLIIQLMDGDVPVCYYRDNISNYMNLSPEYRWIQLLPDKAINRVQNINEAGMISFKLSVNDLTNKRHVDFSLHPAWSKPPAMQANTVMIRAYIYQCKDLAAAKADGTCNPYVKVWDLSPEQLKTKVIEENTNPLFYEVLQMELEVRDRHDINTYPPFILDLYNQNNEILNTGDTYLARGIIQPLKSQIIMPEQLLCPAHGKKMCQHCQDWRRDNEVPEEPRWHKLYFAPGEPQSGQILVSFSVTGLDYDYNLDANVMDLSSRVQMQEMELEMLILGLRDLKSPGILPVKKAFVKFNIKSLVPPESSGIQNIQTQPGAAGQNPTINTTMKFSIPLPVKSLYCSHLSCQVFDFIFQGWDQPLIGVFNIPIGDEMRELHETKEKNIRTIKEINKKLSALIQGELKPGIGVSINDNESISSYRPESINQALIVTKARIEKAMKGSENVRDYKEQFGANEMIGISHADAVKERRKSEIRNRRRSQYREHMIDQNNGAPKGDKIAQSIHRRSTLRSSTKNRKELEAQYFEDLEFMERDEEDKRIRALEDLQKKGDDASKMVVMPKYVPHKIYKSILVEDYDNAPPKDMFMVLGWDEFPTQTQALFENKDAWTDERKNYRRHYRQYYAKELEKVKDLFPKESPFNKYVLKRGQTRGLKKGGFLSWFQTKKQDESGQLSSEQDVGFFKGIIQIESQHDRDEYNLSKNQLIRAMSMNLDELLQQKSNEIMDIDLLKLNDPVNKFKLEKYLRILNLDHMEIPKHLQKFQTDDDLKSLLLSETKCRIRLYIIEAVDLVQRGNGGNTDPYLFITCNGKTYNERDNYQINESSPKFMKHFDWEGVFPGTTPLKIQIWDYDAIFGDELIGTTILDLEDRFFNQQWRALEHKPIEFRTLYHNSSYAGQGFIKNWVEINPSDDTLNSIMWDIREKPSEEFEVRLCIFTAKDIVLDTQGTSDTFFKGFFDQREDLQETDTHYRNQDGKPDFQYRLVFRIKSNRKEFKLKLQAYDRDFLKSNDLIGEASIDIGKLIEDCELVHKPVSLNKRFYQEQMPRAVRDEDKLIFDTTDENKFWAKLFYKDFKKGGKIISRGQVSCQVDVLPADLADKNPVGKARQEPNHSPYLPQPQGRLELSINPFKMYTQLLGPDIRRKLQYLLCFAVCCLLFLMLLPNITANLVSDTAKNLICRIFHTKDECK